MILAGDSQRENPSYAETVPNTNGSIIIIAANGEGSLAPYLNLDE
jgi:hypothetical protein